MSTNEINQLNHPNDDEIDLLALAGRLWDGRWIIIAVTALFTIAGLAYGLLATPIYQANSLIQVEEKQGGLPGMEELSGLLTTTTAATTEIELIKSRSVLGKVVDELRLDIVVEPKYFPVIGEAMARRFSGAPGELAKRVLSEVYAWGGEKLAVSRLDVPEHAEGQPLLLRTTNTGWALTNESDQVLLQGRVNELAQAGGYIMMVTELVALPGTVFHVRKESRYTAIANLQRSIAASEKGKDSGIISLSYNHPDPRRASAILDSVGDHYVRQNVDRNSAEAAQSLDFLRAKLPEVKANLEAAEGRLNTYQVAAESIDITAEVEALLEQIVDLEKGISELEMQRAEIEQRFRPTHPRFQAWSSQMAELKVRRGELDGRIGGLPATQQELVRLRRDVEVGNEIYLQMLANVQQLNIARAGTVGNVRVVDEAAANTTAPVEPKKALVVVLALVLGGFAGFAFVLLRAALNRGVENPEDIEKLGLPVYASIPLSETQQELTRHRTGRLTRKSNADHTSKLLAIDDPADLAVEALRSLRTSLHFGMMDAKNNTLMIAGPSPGVGKTFASINLAAVMAHAGKKVLLIDADMRRGTSHELFQIANVNGLSDLLAGKASLEAVVHQSELQALSFVPRGTVPPNPSELLMSRHFEDFLNRVQGEYDLVIIDTPPILAVTDAAIVGKRAGTTMLVARYGLNSVKEIEITKRRFRQNGIEIKGVILNAVVKKAKSYGYDQIYEYSYHSVKS
ncbi:polysaccharide biosynthesis tyrosine autokinase [Proteobacteria bacterium 005FR1]|nr:polysaccharide biosynthesis tyrosine autokinase [Proteobacteria bacterium 005FR1]